MNILNIFLKELNDEYFNGKKKLPDIRFMARKSVVIFGRTNRERNLIEINPVLLTDLRVLKLVIWHEFCHSILRFRKRKRKFKRFHGKRFKRLESSYKTYNEDHGRFILFVRDYWLSEGYLTKEELKEMAVQRKTILEDVEDEE